MEATFSALLTRPQSLGIREIHTKILVHPNRDPGCFHDPHDLLNGYRADARHALVVLDYDWAGVPADSARSLEDQLEIRLEGANLAPWAAPIVIGPELESWVWSQSPHVDDALGWRGRSPSLRDALEAQGLWPGGASKPPDPKAAVEWATQEARVPRSSSIYRQIARRASMRNCGGFPPHRGQKLPFKAVSSTARPGPPPHAVPPGTGECPGRLRRLPGRPGFPGRVPFGGP